MISYCIVNEKILMHFVSHDFRTNGIVKHRRVLQRSSLFESTPVKVCAIASFASNSSDTAFSLF